MMKIIVLHLIVILFAMQSCSSKSEERRKIVSDLCGSTLFLPDKITARIDTNYFDYNFSDADYKIVTYIDTSGCTPCRMKIPSWNEILNDLETNHDIDLNFLMIINSDSKIGADYAINLGAFPHVVWFDQDNTFSTNNKLPVNDEYHTFLLDADNKILAVGNPADNPKIKDLYRDIIIGGTDSDDIDCRLNMCSKPIKAFGLIEPGDSVSHRFLLRNSKYQILTIQDIVESCDCTIGRACTDTLKQNGRMEIEVSFKADTICKPFIQNVDIYFNEVDEPQRLIIYGIINKPIKNFKS